MIRRTARSVLKPDRDHRDRGEISRGHYSLFECGVDYITATATHSRKQVVLRELGEELVEQEALCGNDISRWHGLGYHGRGAGSASYGVGPQGVLVRASSGLAAENWRRLVQWSTNVSRIDVQVTVLTALGPDTFLSERWEQARQHWLQHPHLREPKLRSGVNGAETIELGSRQSERCGRIYDKGKETKLDHYRNCVRCEAEYKGKVAKAVAHDLLRKEPTPASVVPHVLGFFRKQRVELQFDTYSPTFIKGSANSSDRSKKLLYLEKSIRPLVKKLIVSGSVYEVVEALGLTEWTTVDQEP